VGTLEDAPCTAGQPRGMFAWSNGASPGHR
jgi:hypothetical protein